MWNSWLTLQHTGGSQADDTLGAKNQVIKDLNAQHRPRLNKPLGELNIVGRGIRIA